ncbi:hypothetical protein [Adlercreutzia equolifaciens]|uniref:hypothetical protein n=1 Tax=Adlercreutzia equolifaciens TaxID=446660 RepID=UPI00038977C8|nr:hypothetical protein [Adlercreutzia equolifaciens]RFT84697.1 hypothetical protein DX903_05790 [Adlercreutzia equolifaciens]BAN77158.1 hypothetical protein AEQU_1189 [Adlercreutzia equolifaciens DSM 19450]
MHIGDKAEHPYTGETCTIDCINTFDGSYCLGFVEERSASLCDGERVKRPAPEDLGADGKPIVVGETVWLTDEGKAHAGSVDFKAGPRSYGLFGVEVGEPLTVLGFKRKIRGSDHRFVMFDHHSKPWCDASWITHTHPDTQERIDRDARKGYMTYWECVGCSCERCPAKIDGDKPWRWYHAYSCEGAMVLDLLRRQRELDKRTGGAE